MGIVSKVVRGVVRRVVRGAGVSGLFIIGLYTQLAIYGYR